MKRSINVFVIALLLSSTFALAQATTQPVKRYLNTNWRGTALHGYDPVAYFTDGKPIEGKSEFKTEYKDAKYYFVSAEHKKMFDENPTKYEPQFGGYCAYAVSQNRTADIDPEQWSIIDGRLFLQHNQKAVNLWNQDVSGHLKDADHNWPGIADKNGK